jgi:hypothetical protein
VAEFSVDCVIVAATAPTWKQFAAELRKLLRRPTTP